MNTIQISVINSVSSDRLPCVRYSRKVELIESLFDEPSIISIAVGSGTLFPVDVAACVGKTIGDIDTIVVSSTDASTMELSVEGALIKSNVLVVGGIENMAEPVLVLDASSSFDIVAIPKKTS